jgi:hypothetical protein
MTNGLISWKRWQTIFLTAIIRESKKGWFQNIKEKLLSAAPTSSSPLENSIQGSS